ncbi:Secondary metabolism regulator laeA [Fusarium oxysporum f. sp. conglutinans]|nr:Secondary metabolism regulator laeA [Fusarium oxysporum f. sp. conglutinans]
MADTPPKAMGHEPTGPEPSSPTDRRTPSPVQHEPGEGELQPVNIGLSGDFPRTITTRHSATIPPALVPPFHLASSKILESIKTQYLNDERGPMTEQQNETLDIQHHVFTPRYGWPAAFAPLSDKIEKAVDIGTGTGIWAIDFGDQYPNTEVIGTDLSPISAELGPPNVHFEIDDFAQDWTFKMTRSTLFTHVGSLVPWTDWTALFKQAYMALKPGAWLESFEVTWFLRVGR